MQRWRRTWAEGGPRALNSSGPASLPRLSDEQCAQLERELAKGPAAHGSSTPEHLMQRIRRGLRHIQYRSRHLVDGRLTGPA